MLPAPTMTFFFRLYIFDTGKVMFSKYRILSPPLASHAHRCAAFCDAKNRVSFPQPNPVQVLYCLQTQAVSWVPRGFWSLRFGRTSNPVDVEIPGTTQFFGNYSVGDLAMFWCRAIQHMKGDRSSYKSNKKSRTNCSLTGPLANHLQNWW